MGIYMGRIVPSQSSANVTAVSPTAVPVGNLGSKVQRCQIWDNPKLNRVENKRVGGSGRLARGEAGCAADQMHSTLPLSAL
jgi:hypothetical protein